MEAAPLKRVLGHVRSSICNDFYSGEPWGQLRGDRKGVRDTGGQENEGISGQETKEGHEKLRTGTEGGQGKQGVKLPQRGKRGHKEDREQRGQETEGKGQRNTGVDYNDT